LAALLEAFLASHSKKSSLIRKYQYIVLQMSQGKFYDKALQAFSQPSFQSYQIHAGDRSRLAGIGGQRMKRMQSRLWKFAFLIATFVQRMRPRRIPLILKIL
jgi:hypothetical protein